MNPELVDRMLDVLSEHELFIYQPILIWSVDSSSSLFASR